MKQLESKFYTRQEISEIVQVDIDNKKTLHVKLKIL